MPAATDKLTFKSRSLRALEYRLPALAALLVLFLLPPDGLGWTFCPLNSLVQIPCPGCGLTRSMSSLLHLHLAKSLAYHLLGIPAVLALFAIAATNRVSLQTLPGVRRNSVMSAMLDWKAAIMLFLTVWLFRLMSL